MVVVEELLPHLVTTLVLATEIDIAVMIEEKEEVASRLTMDHP